jgi:1,4-dihydroxy-2-naphthoyl-CoA hydrolase
MIGMVLAIIRQPMWPDGMMVCGLDTWLHPQDLHRRSMAGRRHMAIWKHRPDPERLNRTSVGSMSDHIGIEMTDVGDDFLRGRMPVDHRTQQPMGLMHGGASATLAETLGSIAGLLTVDDDQYCLGLELNISHLRAVQSGYVTGTARPVKLGRTVQVWEIRIEDDDGRLVSISRLTLVVRTGDDPASSKLRRDLGSAAADN